MSALPLDRGDETSARLIEGLVDGETVFEEVGVAGVAKTILEITPSLGNLLP